MINFYKKINIGNRAIQKIYRVVGRSLLVPSGDSYNLTISHQKKFIWFRVAKVGTRTILNHLKENDIILDIEEGSGLHYPVNLYSDYFKFAFVRNPWARLVSCWRNKVLNSNFFNFNDSMHEEMKTFENFVGYVSGLDIKDCDRHLRSQSSLIDLNMLDYLGRLETFDDDVSLIFKKLGLPEKEIARRNVTSTNVDYQDYYTEELANKVAMIYQNDIQIFGYKF